MFDPLRRRVAWLVPYPMRGSGGHRTIFQNLTALVRAGYDCHVYLEAAPPGASPGYATAAEAKALSEELFGPIPATFHLGFQPTSADLVFATAWTTAEPVRRLRIPCLKAYFVQDDEASFMPIGDGYMAARNTFRYGFHAITIGRWLAHRVGQESGSEASFFDFCADLGNYRRLPEVPRERAICFIYQPDKPRRCSVIGAQALGMVKSRLPDVKLYFYGSDRQAQLPYAYEHLGLLRVSDCNHLYNRCQLGLCISATNPSRVPFEMMAAGLPVVDIYGDNNLYDYPDSATLLADPTPESLAWALICLLVDPARRERMAQTGQAFMASRDLSIGYAQFVRFVDRLFQRAHATEQSEKVTRSYHAARFEAPPEVMRDYQEHPAGTVTGPWMAPTPPRLERPLLPRLVTRVRSAARVLLTGKP